MLDVRQVSGVAGCDGVRRSGIDLVVDGSPSPRGGAESEVPFHSRQCGVYVKSVASEVEPGWISLAARSDEASSVVSMWHSARTRAQCGLRYVRVGEASHPGPGSKRRRTQWLRALHTSMESDGESSKDDARPTQLDSSLSEGDQQFVVRPPPSDVIDALEQDLVDAPRPPRFLRSTEEGHVVWRQGAQSDVWPQQRMQAVV